MADVALENAERQRDELARSINTAQQHLEDLRRDLRRVELFISDWRTLAEGKALQHTAVGVVGVTAQGVAAGQPTLGNPVLHEKPLKPERRHNSPKEAVAVTARALIEAHGEPMSRTDLYRELIVQGLTIEGKDPEMVLSTMLWRMGPKTGLVRLKGGGYWLADRPIAGYVLDLGTKEVAAIEKMIGKAKKNPNVL